MYIDILTSCSSPLPCPTSSCYTASLPSPGSTSCRLIRTPFSSARCIFFLCSPTVVFFLFFFLSSKHSFCQRHEESVMKTPWPWRWKIAAYHKDPLWAENSIQSSSVFQFSFKSRVCWLKSKPSQRHRHNRPRTRCRHRNIVIFPRFPACCYLKIFFFFLYFMVGHQS